jgi:O-antigen ligase
VKSTAHLGAVRRPSAIPRQRQHPVRIRNFFFLCGVFVVLPFFDIPFIGLSITAPLILPVIYYAFSQPATPWIHRYRGWIMIASAIWLGMIVSFVASGPWFERLELQAIEIASLVRYLFWLTVFLVTAYIASDFRIQRRLPFLLGIAVVVLAGLRCFEGIVLGKVGAWTNTIFTTQNNYGILFSTFTPFLFPVFLGRGFLPKTLCAAGLLAVLFACAINGSRGSWICIALALAVFFLLALMSRPQTSLRLVLPAGFTVLALAGILAGSARVREAVLSRFSTLNNLEMDKSYMVRQVMNQRNLKLFALSPLFGTGPGRLREVYVPLEMPSVLAGKSDADFMRRSAHNSYLGFLAEDGLVASLPLAALLMTLAIRGALAAMALNRKGERWALGVYASFIAMSVHFWSLAGLTGTHAWFIYGLLAATIVLAARVREQRSATVARPQVVRPRRAFGSGRPAVVGSPQPAILTTDH